VAPLQDGLMLEMLRYANELKDPAAFFDKVPAMKPPKEMIDLAVQLIDSKSGPFKADEFQDHYGSALAELVQTKIKGQAILAPPEATPARTGKVVNLMEALKRSLEEGDAAAKKKPASRKKKTG